MRTLGRAADDGGPVAARSCCGAFSSSEEEDPGEDDDGSGASSSSESEGGPRASGLAWSPLLGRDVVLDDEQATYVLVFTRAAAPGTGVVDRGADIPRPLESARLIFKQAKDQNIEELGSEPMSAEEYHGVVRRRIEALLSRSGFTCASFRSVDGDETFLKIYLDPEGDTVRALAERFEYSVPLRKACYESIKRITNKEGSLCFAHTPFTLDLYERGMLQRLRRVDVIRIAHRHLSSLVDLEQLCEQKFVSTHFAAAAPEEQRDLRSHWKHPLRFRQALLPPQIRDYFGEKVGFFFHFFAFFVRATVLLGAIALCFVCKSFVARDLLGKPLDRWQENYCQMVFGAAIVCWAILFETRLNRSSARLVQVWGMSAWRLERSKTGRASHLKTFKDKLVGRSRERYGFYAASLCTGLYCALFIVGVAAMKLTGWRLTQHTDWAVAGMVVFAKWLWGKIAPIITGWENHKTQHRFDDKLFLRLAIFKTFFVLWPGLSIFSFDKVAMAHCGNSFEKAVEAAYGPLSQQGHAAGFREWPDDGEAGVLNETNFAEKLSEYKLTKVERAFRRMSWDMSGEAAHEECLAYCLPRKERAKCYLIAHSGYLAVDCKTNCHDDLQSIIQAQFVLHVVVQFAFILYPMLQVRYDINKEVSAASQMGSGGSASLSGVCYTDLQVQAKRQVYAKYEYYSFGGSYVEDTLELLLGFAYISVFGLMCPYMVVIAAVVLVIEYFLLHMRMLYVTGRPFPDMASDIGSSNVMIVFIGTIAVFINGYLLAFVLGPARSRDFEEKFIIFLCFGACSLFLRTLVRNALAGDPHDVRTIDDHNADVLEALHPVEISMEFDQGKHVSRVDIGL